VHSACSHRCEVVILTGDCFSVQCHLALDSHDESYWWHYLSVERDLSINRGWSQNSAWVYYIRVDIAWQLFFVFIITSLMSTLLCDALTEWVMDQEFLNFDGLLPSHQVYVENTVHLFDLIESFWIHIETDLRTPFEFRKLPLFVWVCIQFNYSMLQTPLELVTLALSTRENHCIVSQKNFAWVLSLATSSLSELDICENCHCARLCSAFSLDLYMPTCHSDIWSIWWKTGPTAAALQLNFDRSYVFSQYRRIVPVCRSVALLKMWRMFSAILFAVN